MKRLPEQVKRRIVEHLACCHTHAEVVDLIAEEFDITLTPRHVRAYDPTCSQCVASERLRTYFAAVRERLAKEIAAVPIANRTFRLHQLQKIYAKSVATGDLDMARHALEQAAKEVGGMFVNGRVAARHGRV